MIKMLFDPIGHLARRDVLTGLPNRYAFRARLVSVLEAASRQGRSVAVVNVDLDRFRRVNELCGEAAGDLLLVEVSRRMAAQIEPSDTLARAGGDEFLILLTSRTQPDLVATVTARVIEALRQPFLIERRRIDIGASIGVSFYPEDGTTPEALTKAAASALNRAKEEGRGAVHFYEASMDRRVQLRFQLGQDLAGAIERGELLLHYQPIVSGITGEVENFEALLRWRHPVHGQIPPSEFIPLAEETGLIDAIGSWVIDEAVMAAASWPRPWRVSINVSPAQFRDRDMCAILHKAIRDRGLSSDRVVIEVTESVLIENATKAVSMLNRLRDLGVRIALDDFGTGFSSLSYLRVFKFDKLKIDRSFVAELGHCDDALTLTRAIVNLGHNLGLQVTAEGVETADQLEIVRALGCDQVQGYLIARPAPVEAFGSLEQMRAEALFDRSRVFDPA